TENRAKNALDSRCIRPFSENSAVCLANYGVPPLRGKLIGASLSQELAALRRHRRLTGRKVL
ncbi:hypothetical protein, partial [Pseudomonas syringae]|uniref:hypothetical protein n=1 Tax=Pseudomonas syringae TaxID=317 RepID=UPI001F371D12